MLPLEDTLVRLGSVGARLSLRVPAGGRAIGADELIEDGPVLTSAVRACEISLGTDAEVAASLFHKQWSVSVARAAVGAFTAERRVPDLVAENTVLILDRMGRPTGASLRTPRLAVLAGDPDAAHPDSVVVADEAALRDWLRARVIDGHLTGAVEAMAALGLLTEEQLWGNVAAACAGALAVLSNRWGPIEELAAEAAELLDVPGAPTRGLARLVPHEQGGSVKLHVRRETCCLHHCLPADPPQCSSCPLLDEEERVRRRQAHLLGS
jgi:hypothetical protein